MAATSWTQTDLDNLEKAIAQGALRVRYGDREVIYQSRDDMMKARNTIRKALGLVTSGPTRKVASFSKGF
jgi:hypothetical protein